MKKLTLSIVSLVAFLFIATTAFSVTTDDPKPLNSTGITYVVVVHPPNNLLICHSFYVAITDKNGFYVVPPQQYIQGINTYVFHENGPFAGVRIANLRESYHSHQHVCVQNVYTYPDAKFQKFMGSTTYEFHLYPRIVPVDEVDE